MPPRFLFAGGGSGGHAVPALAVAEAVHRRYPRAEILFAGTARGVESKLVPHAGYPLQTLPVIGLKRELHPDLLRFPFVLIQGFIRALRTVVAFRPHAVICTGGYVSGPVGVAAAILGIPLILHEQNGFPGLTVRLLSRAAAQVHLGFEDALKRTGGRFRQVVGNPIRASWQKLDRDEARKQLNLAAAPPTLAVVGGSQGSLAINLALIEALPTLMNSELQILWQTGEFSHERVKTAASPWSDRILVTPFVHNMAALYSAADLALTRAGAMTLVEQAFLGVPAVLVPLPTAAENHQEYNARARVRAGAARMILQKNLSGAALSRALLDLVEHPETLSRMSARCRDLYRPGAADRIAADLVRVLKVDG